MGRYSYCEDLIYRFIKSNSECILVNWYNLGYSSLNSANKSFRLAIDKFEFNCHVITHRGDLYLIKNGCEVPERLPKKKIRDRSNKPEIWVDKFYKSSLKMVQIPWMKLDYASSSSCYNAIKRAILNYEYSEDIAIFLKNDDVFMVKCLETDGFEEFYEFVYCE